MLKPHEITNLGRQLAKFKNIMNGWQSKAPLYNGTLYGKYGMLMPDLSPNKKPGDQWPPGKS